MSAPDFLLSDKCSLPLPCFVIDAPKLQKNAAILAEVQAHTGAKILLALKAFSAFEVFPMLSREFDGPLWGTCASSVDEARLGRERFGGEVHAFAAAWGREEIGELLELADHIVFNSAAQLREYAPVIAAANAKTRRHNPVGCGIRVNPEHSEGAVAIYNPCSPGSRLGMRHKEVKKLNAEDWRNVEGLHFHTLCEQGADALARTLMAFERGFSPYISGQKWLNFGGGHHITRQDYDRALLENLLLDWKKRYGCQIYLEPGEAVALDAGWLLTKVLDIVDADMPVAILDTSAACHMPDVLEMPYRPDVWYREGERAVKAGVAEQGPYNYRLAGKSCLAGDVIGEYSFRTPLYPGMKLVFADMAIYSMVKTNTFNGIRLPSIAVYEGDGRIRLIRKFAYQDFLTRLS